MSLYNNQLRSEPHFPVVKFYYYKEWRQFEMKPHAHEAIEFMHVLSGSCKVETNTESYQLKKRSNYLLRCTYEPSTYCDRKM